jgi:hypothetical protein
MRGGIGGGIWHLAAGVANQRSANLEENGVMAYEETMSAGS